MRKIPPCFGSAADATLENASNDNMAAAIAGTLRMLLSLQFRPHIGPIFSDDSMAEVPRNQQGLRVILVLRSNAGGGAISAGGRGRRGGGGRPGGTPAVFTRGG